MKKYFSYFYFLFFPLAVLAQNDSLTITKPTIAVISADKLNIVYRGIFNPISISVPNCKSFTATAEGLTKESEGKYNLAPGLGLYSIIKVDIELNDGSKVTEEHKFRIKGVNPPIGTINGLGCYQCIITMTKEELQEVEISYKIDDLAINISPYPSKSFVVKFLKEKSIIVEGSTFNPEVLQKIKKLKTGSIFSIDYISPFIPGSPFFCSPRIAPIKIMIVDKEIEE